MGFFKNKDDKKVIIPGFNEPEDSGVEIEGETIVLPMEDGSYQSFHLMDTIEYKYKIYDAKLTELEKKKESLEEVLSSLEKE